MSTPPVDPNSHPNDLGVDTPAIRGGNRDRDPTPVTNVGGSIGAGTRPTAATAAAVSDQLRSHAVRLSSISAIPPLPAPPPPPPIPSNVEIMSQVHQLAALIQQMMIDQQQMKVGMMSGPPPPLEQMPPVKQERKLRTISERKSTPYSGDDDGDQTYDDDCIIDDDRSVVNVRFPMPSKFTGAKADDQMALRYFISSMDRYFDAIGVGHKSLRSGTIAAMQLADVASNWFDQVRSRDPDSVATWSRLKAQLKPRFEPVALETMAYRKLLAVRFNGSVSSFNNDFTKYLQMTKFFNDPSADEQLFHVYMNGLTSGGGASYVSTILRSLLNNGKIKSLNDLMQEAVVAESCLPDHQKNRVGRFASSSTAAANYRPSTGGSSNSGWWRNSSSSRFRTPVRNNGVAAHGSSSSSSSDARVNNLDGREVSLTDDDVAGVVVDGDHGWFPTQDDAVEADMNGAPSSNDDDPTIEVEVDHDLILNVMNFTAKNMKRFPSLSVHELDRLRRAGSCFKCKGAGHYARNCPQGGSGGGSGSGGSSSSSSSSSFAPSKKF